MIDLQRELPLALDQKVGSRPAICGEMELHGLADEASYEIEEHSIQSRSITFRFWWD